MERERERLRQEVVAEVKALEDQVAAVADMAMEAEQALEAETARRVRWQAAAARAEARAEAARDAAKAAESASALAAAGSLVARGGKGGALAVRTALPRLTGRMRRAAMALRARFVALVRFAAAAPGAGWQRVAEARSSRRALRAARRESPGGEE